MKKLFKIAVSLMLAASCAFGGTALAQEAPALGGNYVPVEIRSVGEQTQAFSVIPEKYDLRDYGRVTGIKNQNPFGTCWAFAAISGLESSAMTGGFAGGDIDLSELHLAYFLYNTNADPLGGTEGDSTIANTSEKSLLNVGGNNMMAAMQLMKWSGAQDEGVTPYSGATEAEQHGIDKAREYSDPAMWVRSATFISSTDRQLIKQTIMDEGAAAVMYYYDSFNYNFTYNSYYNPSTPGTNHVISVIGWDDGFSRSKFNQKPKANGAWLCKNSWGEDFEDYFWISYEDNSLMYFSSFVFTAATPASPTLKNYQYDGNASLSYTYSEKNGETYANVFTAKEDGRICAAAIGLPFPESRCSIMLYKNPSSADPESGEPMLSKPLNITFGTVGYHTADIAETPAILAGERFSVVVSVENQYMAAMYTDGPTDYGWVKTVSAAKPGQSYWKQNGSWSDLGAQGYNLRIKAYTTASAPERTKLTAENDTCESIHLSWTPSFGAKGYQLFRKPLRGGAWQNIANTVTGCSYTDRTVTPGEFYYYSVRAVNAYGKAPLSNCPAVCARPEKIASLSATADKGKITLKWSAAADITRYYIRRYEAGSGTGWTGIAAPLPGTQSYADRNVKAGKTYMYYVWAYKTVNGKNIFGFASPLAGVKAK